MGQFLSLRNVSVLSPTIVYVRTAGLSSVQQQIPVLVTVACSVSDSLSSVLPSSVFLLIRLVSRSPPTEGRSAPAHFVQTSCGPGWISSPARLLLEIQTGFWSQSKSGRPSLSQHTTGPSLSVYSSSVSAVNTHTQGGFMIYSLFFYLHIFTFLLSNSPVFSSEYLSPIPTRQQECCEGEDPVCSSGDCPASAPRSPWCV